MHINKELLKGSTVILILKLLDQNPMYGYEMIKAIEEKSGGIFSFKEGTLYPILHNLEQNGLLESYWDDENGKRKRKYYKITKDGKFSLKEKKKEWTLFRSAVEKVLLEGCICQ
ncbi:PadR family transcriptional regulator [Marinisporobacter balticus]|uniref:DNA-binding PadR family transcriptional regulator n=1 Tax=Marinisporobacter balticus TaxID=2018667 RepID=A0A4R2KUF1_9FIRM|nr:PadR family transcriptional regulator [Marinisporobacter balticus]TCO74756.1 DNA-binding PadR family transcriptional regulator [Marinisporobacter balticus]